MSYMHLHIHSRIDVSTYRIHIHIQLHLYIYKYYIYANIYIYMYISSHVSHIFTNNIIWYTTTPPEIITVPQVRICHASLPSPPPYRDERSECPRPDSQKLVNQEQSRNLITNNTNRKRYIAGYTSVCIYIYFFWICTNYIYIYNCVLSKIETIYRSINIYIYTVLCIYIYNYIYIYNLYIVKYVCIYVYTYVNIYIYTKCIDVHISGGHSWDIYSNQLDAKQCLHMTAKLA